MKTTETMRVRAFAPASIGNLAVGFDTLGLALEPEDGHKLGDEVVVELLPAPAGATPASGFDPAANELIIAGPYASALPDAPRHNLVMLAKELFDTALLDTDLAPRPSRLTLYKNLPVCSGLGSSASSTIAALAALNAAYRNPLSTRALLALAGELERLISGSIHFDNVAPALYGGLCLIVPLDVPGERVLHCQLPTTWGLVVVHPDLSVATSDARNALPTQIPLAAAVRYWQRLAAFVQAIAGGQHQIAERLLSDTLIEPFRRPLVKGFAQVKKAALAAGAFACSLSGSGPSMFAMTANAWATAPVAAAMTNAFLEQGINSHSYLCRPNGAGASVTEEK